MPFAVLALGAALVLATTPPPAGEPSSRAQEAYERGVEHFRGGRFREAVVEFNKAYRADPNPVLVFNMARAFEEMKRYEAAIEFYRRYLEMAPEADDRAAVEEGLRALEILQREEQEAAAAAPPPAEPEPPAAAPDRTWVWFNLGLGTAMVATGITFSVLAADRADSLDAIDARPAGHTAREYRGLQDEGRLYAGLGDGLILGGALGLTAALVLWLLEDGEPSVAPVVGPVSGFGGRF